MRPRPSGQPIERPIEIRAASFPADRSAVLEIFSEYVASPKADLTFQDYTREFAQLPGSYAGPCGCILLAWAAGELAGCAALRPVDAVIGEMKRVYVRPLARGLGLGRQLVTTLIAQARNAGYHELRLDVLPEFTAARALYAQLGFLPAAPVSHNPIPGTAFLGLSLMP